MTREEGELIPGMARIVYLHPEEKEEEEEEEEDYLNTQTKNHCIYSAAKQA